MLGNVAISLSDDITCLSKRKRQNSGFPAEILLFVPSLNTTAHCSGGGVSNCQIVKLSVVLLSFPPAVLGSYHSAI